MRLPRPFYRLNVRFDTDRLRAEVADIPAAAWVKHPNEIPGNSSVRLISVDGGENDAVNGRMAMTPHLRRSPYIRQVLASFGVVWGRSRLMRLAPRAVVPQHADINYHWFNRVRLHLPVITRPAVRFYCGDDSVHMAAGEAWLFDNWRQHRVENDTDHERIHLVADTSGGSSFWQFVAQSQSPGASDVVHRFDPQRDPPLLTEQTVLAPVMPPAEVDLLITDLCSEFAYDGDAAESAARLARYRGMLDNFCKDWRQLYLLHGESKSGRAEFTKLLDSVRNVSKTIAEGILIRTNRVSAHTVLEARVLRPMLAPGTPAADSSPAADGSPAADSSPATDGSPPTDTPAPRHARPPGVSSLQRPVFIVAAPRSGSTLLFETLASSDRLVSLGGEAHALVEGLTELRPGAPGVESNRLTAANCTPAIAAHIRAAITGNLVDRKGLPATALGRRFLEKTPKNSLRIPFFDRIFPDALFVYLWREPKSNISSIIEAWRSGNWMTYNGLEGFDGPWSLILPPGWRAMNGRALEEIAAYQWSVTNETVLADLNTMQRARWVAVSYADLVAAPAMTIRRVCDFIGIDVDPALQGRLEGTLPLSRHTHTPPAPDKWRRNSELIERVIPSIQATWERLGSLAVQPPKR
jgi:LPS sulfotransferase NodH